MDAKIYTIICIKYVQIQNQKVNMSIQVHAKLLMNLAEHLQWIHMEFQSQTVTSYSQIG